MAVENGDFSRLSYLNEEILLSSLKSRYEQDKIYSKCGDILIAVNPNRTLPLYDDQHHGRFRWQNASTQQEPHVFSTASLAFQRLEETKTDQVILVSGESGAGKTETTKYVIKHIVNLCGNTNGDLHKKILSINPLMEAFGNARTNLNGNSSRFGKFIQMNFDSKGGIQGAIVRDYLLEKSRVVHQSKGEGNFHIFYAFLAGVDPTLRKKLLLDKDSYRIAKRISGDDEYHRSRYHEYLDIMRLIRLPKEDIEAVQIILAAILHITEITFEEDDSIGVVVSNEDEMITAASLLGVDPDTFGKSLVLEDMVLPDEKITTFKSLEQAEDGRDALAKSLYERLFGWMIRNINMSLHSQQQFGGERMGSLGILDICGFEIMYNNGLEQLCINLVNEQLQSFMNKQVFIKEEEIYASEGLTLQDVQYPDNAEIIEMFTKRRHGIIALIDEDTKLAQATNMSLVHKLQEIWSHHDHFVSPTYDVPEFGIKHFAGEVTYNADNFMEKNADNLSSGILSCVRDSENDLISDLFKVQKSLTGSISVNPFNYRQSKLKSRPMSPSRGSQITKTTVTELRKSMKANGMGNTMLPKKTTIDHKTQLSYFTESIKDLLNKMNSADPLFIRCIKPNNEQRERLFNDKKVNEQLSYLGIKEIAKIRKMCYPIRSQYTDFAQSYNEMIPPKAKSKSDMDICKLIIKEFFNSSQDYKFGKTQVFMMESVKETLDRILGLRRRIMDRSVKKAARKWKDVWILKKIEKEKNANKPMSDILMTEDASPKPLARDRKSAVHFEWEPIEEMPDEEYSVLSYSNQGSRHENNNDIFTDSNADSGATKDDNADYDDIKFWDVFEIVPSDSEADGGSGEKIIRIIKLCLYILFFLILLGCCVCQKLSLIVIVRCISVWNLNSTTTSCIINLVLAISIPTALNIIFSIFKILFGKFECPSLITFILVTALEIIHTFGLCLLVYGILPFCQDAIVMVLLLSAVAIIPSLLLTVTATHRVTKDAKIDCGSNSRVCLAFSYLLDGLSILAQASVIVAMIYWFNEEHTRNDNMKNVTFDFRILEISIGFICVSVGWWENFLDDRFLCRLSETNRLKNFNLFIRYELQNGRHFTVIPAAIAKFLVVIFITYAYFPSIIDYDLVDLLPDKSDLILIPLIMLHLSCLVAFYIGGLACKLNMQLVSFSLPLLLVTPVTVAIILLDCEYHFMRDLIEVDVFCNEEGLSGYSIKFIIGAVWYLSLMWITRHIWFPRQERLAKHERMFVNPLYCVVLTTESFLLNRRRHMRRVLKNDTKKDKNVVTYKLARTESKDDTESAGSINDNESIYPKDDQQNNAEVPLVYACATMWHETRTEMVQLLKSIHRVDAEQCMRKTVEELSGPDPDFFNFEAHIFFDDIMELNDDEDWQVNDFVALFVDCMEEAISSVIKTHLKPHPPLKIPTPYGGQLVYKMPGGNLLYVHLKDKNKIRHRKRWSQVMYMYYLLGFKLLNGCRDLALDTFKEKENKLKERNNEKKTLASDLNDILSEETKTQSQNTFILALDGDTDFTAVSVRILLDRMKKNDKAAAACGRIHPIGSGPIVWFQKFEYAVGHWLQKATEHVFGCVLCSPGCFSLFRASALMDQNVMKKYTILPSDPGHYLQYDQGEDRWLCTLLLQQGYRVDYAAAADAVTYAPEGFNEFFNQRRRWMPSTMANIMDLLGDYKNTVKNNNNISMLYIIYQASLMLSTVLGPATVLLMISGAFKQVFELDIWWSYAISLVPTVAYVIVCLTCTSKIQLLVAVFLSTFYAFVMVIVLAGAIVNAVTVSPLQPSVLFLTVLFGIFLFTGLMHPYEFACLPWGALYFLCIPSGYLLLVIFSLCNLDNISWGTREVAKKKTKAEQEAEKIAQETKKQEKKQGLFSKIFFNKGILSDLKEIFAFGKRDKDDPLLLEIKSMNKKLSKLTGESQEKENLVEIKVETPETVDSSKPDSSTISEQLDKISSKQKKTQNRDPNLPFWAEDPRLGNGHVRCLDKDELEFWEGLIKKYLYPIDKDPEKEKQVKRSLKELRNNVVYAMCMINLLWIGINFIFQYKPNEATIIVLPYEYGGEYLKVEVLGFIFIFFFAVVLFLQFIGMLLHRYGTFLHLISITEINGRKRDQTEFEKMLTAYRQIHNNGLNQIMETEPPDFSDLKKSLAVSRRSLLNPTRKVTRMVSENIRSTSRPLPPIVPDTLEEMRRFRAMSTKVKPHLGFDLKKTAKGLIKQAEEEGIQFDSFDLDPPPDYGDETSDPVIEFFKGKNTMSKVFARKYQKHANAHRTRRPSYYNRKGSFNQFESISRNNSNGTRQYPLAQNQNFRGDNFYGRIDSEQDSHVTQF